MEANGTIMETAGTIITEGSKLGKGTKASLLGIGGLLLALGIYKTVKFFNNKAVESEMEDAAAEYYAENNEAEEME